LAGESFIVRVLVSVAPSIQAVVQETLEDYAYDAILCSDPVEAVGLFITKPFEMFLCDLRSDDTGVEVAGTMKRMDGGRNLRVIFVARDRAQTDAVQGRVGGSFEIAAILREPVSQEDLTKTLDRIFPSKRTASGDLSGSWPTMEGDPESPRQVEKDKPLTQREKARLLVMKLRRERDRVQQAPPHEVLRLPAAPDRSEIEEARRTLKRRYLKVVKSDDVPPEAKQMAAELAQLVDHAYIEMCAVGPRMQKQRRIVSDDERLTKYLEHARELVEQQQWDRADKLLAQARLLRQDHVKVLAWSGWSRYHNPLLDRDKREEHAKDLMMMAEQFDEYDFDCQYFLAQFLQASGDLEGAWRRIVRATRVDAEHQGAKNLFQKIKKLGGKLLQPEDEIV
jgi:DNA-binding response OmpR family regulator